MRLHQHVKSVLEEHGLFDPERPVVVGVSGGLDSAALLALLEHAGVRVVAAHVNYGLRGADSDADEAVVRANCRSTAFPPYVPLFVDRPTLGDGNVQAEARRARYAFFERVAAEVGAVAIATGHHRDDQAETLMLHLFRGTGPSGLAGIPVCRPVAPGSDVALVRPLLAVGKEELRAYLARSPVEWREDRTNHEGDYRRTALRHTILPAIEKTFGPKTSQRIAETAARMRGYLDAGVAFSHAAALDAAAERTPSGWALRLDALRRYAEPERHGVFLEALRRWAPAVPRSAAVARSLDALIDAQPGRRVEWESAATLRELEALIDEARTPPQVDWEGVTVWRDRRHLVFETEPPPRPQAVAVEVGRTETPVGTLVVEEVAAPERFDSSPLVEYLDPAKLRFPLTLRPWEKGDAFTPYGMWGGKKVSDLLTERKVPPQERARQLVLLSDGEIVWVVGHRLAEEASLRVNADRAVRLVWNPDRPLAPDAGAR